QKRAARVGFDWPDASGAMAKVEEELEEVREAVDGGNATRIGEEVGDLLFAAVNVARLLGVDAEQALRGSNDRFERRFRSMEKRLLEQDRSMNELDLEALEEAWEAA
ncbi:MAG: nucleoside triphosphate pyrophosphohydrolase, partial [Gammaproteobacteria bacterium]